MTGEEPRMGNPGELTKNLARAWMKKMPREKGRGLVEKNHETRKKRKTERKEK